MIALTALTMLVLQGPVKSGFLTPATRTEDRN